MAAARKPASASAGSWARQAHQNSGKPCSSRTSGAPLGPVSARWKRAPFAATYRCSQGPRISTTSATAPGRATGLLPLEDLRGLLRLVDGAFRAAHPADQPDADQAQQAGEGHVSAEHDQEAVGQGQAGEVDEQ